MPAFGSFSSGFHPLASNWPTVIPISRKTFKAAAGLPKRRGSVLRAFANIAPPPLRGGIWTRNAAGSACIWIVFYKLARCILLPISYPYVVLIGLSIYDVLLD